MAREVTKIKEYPIAVRIVIGKLREAGYEAYMVGGCVRDALLGREPHDWDVTTSAEPEETLRVFEAFRTIPTGLKHGTVSVLIDNLMIEVTTFRIDGKYTDSRRPDAVTFTKELSGDLARRDFTVNAMAYNEAEGFVDLYGGREDLEAGCIRAVGDPETRFHEDALRILRAVRFAVQLGFRIEENTLRALKTCREGLGNISAERIREEFLKILICPRAGEGMTILADAGLLAYILPGMDRLPEVFSPRTLDILPYETELRLAYLLYPFDKETAGGMLAHLKPSAAFAGTVKKLHAARLPEQVDRPSARRFAVELGDRVLSEFALTLIGMTAESGYEMEAADTLMTYICDAYDEGDCLRLADLAVNGSDLIAAGLLPPSPKVGEILEHLFLDVLDEPERNDRETLMTLARSYVAGEAGETAEDKETGETGETGEIGEIGEIAEVRESAEAVETVEKEENT